MNEPDGHETSENSPGGMSADELRWLWIRLGVRVVIGLLVVGATLLLIFTAG